MSDVFVIRRLHHHRMWAGQRVLNAAERLSVEQLHQQFEIGQGSVWKTLTHLLAADFVWLEALEGNDDPLMRGDTREKLPGNQEGENPIESLAELSAEWQAVNARWHTYLDNLTDETLTAGVCRISTSSGYGKLHVTPAVDVLIHLCTHAQYTIAQLVNMLRQLGQNEYPAVMMITMSREEAASSSSTQESGS